MKTNIDAILKFFDNSVAKENSKYSNTIVSLIGEELSAYLLKMYLSENQSIVRTYNIPCKQKGRKGKQLDLWVYYQKDKSKILYQVEIKTWNSNSIDGKPIKLDADIKETMKYAQEVWKKQWDYTKKEFSNDKVNKTLIRMDPPEWFDPKCERRALVIFWLPTFDKRINNLAEGILTRKNISVNGFKSVYIFSVSMYLRKLRKEDKIEFIDLPQNDFPIFYSTIGKIKEIFSET